MEHTNGTTNGMPQPQPQPQPQPATPNMATCGLPFVKVTTFMINGHWRTDAYDKIRPTCMDGQMFVELHEPMIEKLGPVVLIHGDFHTGQVWQTKPDELPGWASFFASQGRKVYIVDLPGCGRSSYQIGCQPDHESRRRNELAVARSATGVVRMVASSSWPASSLWPTANLHTQWPGAPRWDDPILERYFSGLTQMTLTRAERQSQAQGALQTLLEKIGKAVLIGHGTGAIMAWLAADVVPDKVAAVVALEGEGPPFGDVIKMENGRQTYTSTVELKKKRRWGIADIPMMYDPPLPEPDAPESCLGTLNPKNTLFILEQRPCAEDVSKWAWFQAPLENEDAVEDANAPSVIKALEANDGGEAEDANEPSVNEAPVANDGGAEGVSEQSVTVPPKRFRQLRNLKQMPHAFVTAQASAHSVFDWATVRFMLDAGLRVDWIQLQQLGIFGNGHMMFLEKNSDQIADLVNRWIVANAG